MIAPQVIVERSRGVLIGVVLAAAIILAVVLFSGFSIGTITETASNPFGPGEGQPRIIMVHDGKEYEGELRGYVYDSQRTVSQLPDINLVNITGVSPDNVVNVTGGSELQFVVEGNPAPEARLDALAVTAFTKDGRPVAVLDPKSPQDDTYAIDRLEEGREYVLSAVATWKADEVQEEINGYVIYGYRINVTDQ